MTANPACTPDWKEMRRWRALELKREGCTHQEVADALGVTKGAVSQWMTAVREQGERGLQARPRSGAPPKLMKAELDLIPDFLSHGAEAYGFRGEVWTCARIATVIEREFGVSYHKAHVSRLLKELEWTPPKPITRATQRDELKIVQWRKEVWPELKKKPVVSVGSLSLLMKQDFICCLAKSKLMPPVVRLQSCESTKHAIICRS